MQIIENYINQLYHGIPLKEDCKEAIKKVEDIEFDVAPDDRHRLLQTLDSLEAKTLLEARESVANNEVINYINFIPLEGNKFKLKIEYGNCI